MILNIGGIESNGDGHFSWSRSEDDDDSISFSFADAGRSDRANLHHLSTENEPSSNCKIQLTMFATAFSVPMLSHHQFSGGAESKQPVSAIRAVVEAQRGEVTLLSYRGRNCNVASLPASGTDEMYPYKVDKQVSE